MRALILSLLIAGCTFDPAGRCSADADCTSGLRCSGGVCSTQSSCAAASDCHAWETCGAAKSCVALAGRCNVSGDCQAAQVCDNTNTCATAPGKCTTAADCTSFESCGPSNVCVLQGGRCISSSDCGTAQTCNTANTCVAAQGKCTTAADCTSFETCGADHLCAVQAGRCVNAADCQSFQTCDPANTCVTAAGKCVAASDCASFETCSSHACVLAAGRCRSNADCPQLVQTCDETVNSCSIGAGGDVLLAGSIADGCGGAAIARFDDPTHPQIGFSCLDFSGGSTAHIMSDGSIWYQNGDTFDMRQFVPDSFTFVDKRVVFPVNQSANDPVILAPDLSICAQPGQLLRWAVQGGRGKGVLWGCPVDFGKFDYYDAAGTKVLPFVLPVLAWNEDDVKLLQNGQTLSVMDAAGIVTPVRLGGVPLSSDGVTHTHPGGFWIASVTDATDPANLEISLIDIDNSGSATVIGVYADAPPGQPATPGGVLDSTGVLYSIRESTANLSATDIVRRPLRPETSSVVYSQAEVTPEDFTVFPPKLSVSILLGSLIGSP